MPGWYKPCGGVVTLYVGEGSKRQKRCLLGPQTAFSHFPHYPQVNWALVVLSPQVGRFVYVLGPCVSLQPTLLLGWEFYPSPQSPQDFTARGFEALVSLCNPGLCGLSRSPGVPPRVSACEHGTAQSASYCLACLVNHPATRPLCSYCPCPPYWSGLMFFL